MVIVHAQQPSRTASTSRNSSAAVFSSLVHDRRDRARRGPLTLVPLRSDWHLACGNRAAPGSLPLIPPGGGTHSLRMTPNTQTDGRHRADGPCKRCLLNPVSSLASVGKEDRGQTEGEGACLPVCREAITPSGSGSALLRHRPLRTGRAGHPASGSSHSSAPWGGTEPFDGTC